MDSPAALAARTAALLTTSHLGRTLSWVAETGSTNADLRAGPWPHGAVRVAEAQTAGRGRLGRRWEAPAGTGLLFSVLLRPSFPPPRAGLLSLCAALAAAQALDEAGLPIALKWPNDLVCRGLKLGGILSELSMQGDAIERVVIGVGLNVDLPREALPQDLAPTATSLLLETGRPADRPAVLAAFLGALEGWVARLSAGEGDAIVDAFAARCYTLGREVAYDRPGGELRGIAEALDRGGALLVRGADGALHTITAGDVRVRVPGPAD